MKFIEGIAKLKHDNWSVHKLNKDLVKSMFLARESYIKGSMDMIKQHYGTVHTFLESKIGIGTSEITQLKEILVDY